MAKQVHYNAAEHIAAKTAEDPYLRPAFAASDRARRFLWNACRAILYRPSPRAMFAWRPSCCDALARQWGRTAISIQARECGPRGTWSARTRWRWPTVRRSITLRRCASVRTPSSRRMRICAARPTTTTIRASRCWPTRWRWGVCVGVCACLGGSRCGRGRGSGAGDGFGGNTGPGAVGNLRRHPGGEGEGAQTSGFGDDAARCHL